MRSNSSSMAMAVSSPKTSVMALKPARSMKATVTLSLSELVTLCLAGSMAFNFQGSIYLLEPIIAVGQVVMQRVILGEEIRQLSYLLNAVRAAIKPRDKPTIARGLLATGFLWPAKSWG